MLKWLTGKKTYVGAAALAITLIVGFWFGTIDATTLAAGLSTCLVIVGFGHKYDRYIAAATALLVEAKSHNVSIKTIVEELPNAVSPANPNYPSGIESSGFGASGGK